MTRLLKRAFDEASKLDSSEQDSIAQWLLDELTSDRRWDAAFKQSTESLTKLAEEALAEDRAGRTLPFDPNLP